MRVSVPGGSVRCVTGPAEAGGHPFFKPDWGADVVGMVLDDGADWQEVAELLTESYRVLAPKRLAVTVDGPPGATA